MRPQILSNVVSLVGWTVVAAAPSVNVICVGRFVNGLAAAAIALAGKEKEVVLN
jgi:hypothetical protein